MINNVGQKLWKDDSDKYGTELPAEIRPTPLDSKKAARDCFAHIGLVLQRLELFGWFEPH